MFSVNILTGCEERHDDTSSQCWSFLSAVIRPRNNFFVSGFYLSSNDFIIFVFKICS